MPTWTSSIAASLLSVLLGCSGASTSDSAFGEETETLSSPSLESVMAGLSPLDFGDEQPMLYGIRSGLAFEPSGAPGVQVGTIEVRGLAVEVQRRDADGEARIGVDLNLDQAIADDEFASGRVTEHVLTIDGDAVLIEIVSTDHQSEYIVRELWHARVEHGGETLALGALQFGENSILFTDNDLDGVYESFAPSGSPIPLGGDAWMIEMDFKARTARLEPTGQQPIAVGYPAPRLAVHALDAEDEIPIIREGQVTALLFCISECFGCQLLKEPLEALTTRYQGDSAVRFLSIGQSHDDAGRSREVVSPGFEHAVSTTAWTAYAVRPTPTLLVIDTNGTIVHRATGAAHDTASLLAGAIEAALQQ